MDAELTDLLSRALLFGVFPLWLVAGFGDWLCHRHCHIATTSGWRESGLHLLMLLELGLPTLAAVFFEINALVIVLLVAGFVLHEITVYIDLRFTSARRNIPPIEQMIHSFLELVPALGGVILLLMNRDTVASLMPGGPEADFALRLKPLPMSVPQLLLLAGASVVFVVAPCVQEFLSGLRVQAADPPGRNSHGEMRSLR